MAPTHVLYQGLIYPFIRLLERSIFILEVLFECNLIFQEISRISKLMHLDLGENTCRMILTF